MEKLNDSDIRNALYVKLGSHIEFLDDPTTVVIDELDICSGLARIDVAVVNGKLHGYEIKSERDNLDRLPSQIEFYSRVFDKMTLVVSKTHLKKARKIIPQWWGIDCVTKDDSNIFIKTLRQPKINKQVQVFNLTELLWKPELLELLYSKKIIKGLKSKTRSQLGEIVVQNIEKEEFSIFMRNTLKAREDWRARLLKQQYDDLQLL